jgi:hypothetical protein
MGEEKEKKNKLTRVGIAGFRVKAFRQSIFKIANRGQHFLTESIQVNVKASNEEK